MPARPAERSSPVRAVKRQATGFASRFTLRNPRHTDSADQGSGSPLGAVGLATMHTMGVVDELRSGSGKAQEGLGGKPSLERHQARLHGGGRRAPARLRAHRAHARAARRGKAMEARQRRGVRQHPRRAHRQPGAAAGQGGPESHLPVRVAGGSRREHRGRNVSGPVAVSRSTRCRWSCAASTTRSCAPIRSSTWRARATSISSRRSSPMPRQDSAACSTPSSS